MPKKTLPAKTAAEALLAMLRERGVDVLFANAGTDFPSMIEALSRAPKSGLEFPTAIAVPHETVVVGMAHGYYMVTGRPQAVMVHTSVGTANAICGLINAARDHVPVIAMAGRSPINEHGAFGSRSGNIHWGQEMYDQGGMLREIVKWDYELRGAEQVETVVDRMLGIAMTEPRGPIYLTLPREVLAQEIDGIEISSPARQDLGGKSMPDPQAVRRAAQALAEAEAPLVLTESSGADPATVPLLVKLSELLAVPVIEFRPRAMNFPTEHAMHLGFEPGERLAAADVVLNLDMQVPWLPNMHALSERCTVIAAGPDPLHQTLPIRGFPSDIGLRAPNSSVLSALIEAAQEIAPKHQGRIAERRGRIAAAHEEMRAAQLAAADRDGISGGQITKRWVSRCVDRLCDRDTIVVNEYPAMREAMTLNEPGSFFGLGSAGGLGWGLPAALGAKLARPEKTVIATMGDGAYMFTNPVACHLTAAAQNLPVLSVVCNNGIWNAVERSTLGLYPKGDASQANVMALTSLDPSPAFETVIEASGGYGERVERPEDLPAALERALKVVKEEKRQALLNVICAK